MAFHVMHAEGRNTPGKCQRLSARSPNQQGSNQSRARRVSNRVDFRRHTVGLGQHLTNQGQHSLDVISGCQLRHHTAISAVQVDLTEQCIGQKPALTVV